MHRRFQFSFNHRRPRPSGTPCSARPPSTISTTPPDLPFRRGGVLGGATQSVEKYLLITNY